ncbi:uncharacterized protein DI49_2146 [Saccharomyces eubayanus]|uniref:uncharacterized protein n=1 Tax=Saccharomyces eubayanus TaxID=1080349 RepID=UPI0006C6AFB0|nr:hypothetical protein DI49_2146 [Saccharomyces eubayanus]KOG99668.1 hypothetical protein DI49_2146 [Saccharomyces eubayanus]
MEIQSLFLYARVPWGRGWNGRRPPITVSTDDVVATTTPIGKARDAVVNNNCQTWFLHTESGARERAFQRATFCAVRFSYARSWMVVPAWPGSLRGVGGSALKRGNDGGRTVLIKRAGGRAAHGQTRRDKTRPGHGRWAGSRRLHLRGPWAGLAHAVFFVCCCYLVVCAKGRVGHGLPWQPLWKRSHIDA